MTQLIECPACNNSVSAMAATCPRCGHPLAIGSEEHPVTTQQTAKRYKGFQLAGSALFIGGLVAFFSVHEPLAMIAVIFGIILYGYGRLGGWWHHG